MNNINLIYENPNPGFWIFYIKNNKLVIDNQLDIYSCFLIRTNAMFKSILNKRHK